jgi:hypothetical protein
MGFSFPNGGTPIFSTDFDTVDSIGGKTRGCLSVFFVEVLGTTRFTITLFTTAFAILGGNLTLGLLR